MKQTWPYFFYVPTQDYSENNNTIARWWNFIKLGLFCIKTWFLLSNVWLSQLYQLMILVLSWKKKKEKKNPTPSHRWTSRDEHECQTITEAARTFPRGYSLSGQQRVQEVTSLLPLYLSVTMERKRLLTPDLPPPPDQHTHTHSQHRLYGCIITLIARAEQTTEPAGW